MWGLSCHSFALQIIKICFLTRNISNIFHLFLVGGKESKSKTENLSFLSFVFLKITNGSPVTEIVCCNLNRQKHNSSSVSPFFFPSLCVNILVMQCLDFLEQIMESGIYSVGLKAAIQVSYVDVKNCCFQNM